MKERLRKIYELSLHGTDGEKANAQELLKNLLSKHRLSIADIADEAKAERRFKPKNKTEVRLLCQIVNKVTDGDNRAIWSYRGSKDRVVELTTAEFIEVELLFSEYIAALKKEQERLYVAFIHANNIFPKNGEKISAADLTAEELKEARRTAALANAIDPTPVNRKRLEAKQND